MRPQDIIGTDEGLWNYCFGFCTKDDNIVEGDESFYIVISPHTDRIKPFDSFEDRFKITILDNDSRFSHVHSFFLRIAICVAWCTVCPKIAVFHN